MLCARSPRRERPVSRTIRHKHAVLGAQARQLDHNGGGAVCGTWDE